MESIDNLQPLLIPENGIVQLNLRTDHKGYLELQSVEGAAIFLFRGALTAVEVKTLLEGTNPFFDLAAAVGQSSQIKMEASMGEITLFSKKTTLGFIRTCQYPVPPYTTQAKLA